MTNSKQYTLRRWRQEDAESLAKQINNKRIWDNCRDSLPYPYTPEDAHAWIGTIIRDESPSAYCIEIGGEAVGNIGFVRGTDIERFSAEVGYWISESHWGKGIMTAALKEAVEDHFSATDVVRLYAPVFAFNKASARVLEKAGFTLKCTLTKAAFKNGQFTDMFYFEKLR